MSIRFSKFEFDPLEKRLFKGRQEIPLPPKLLDLLDLFLQNQNRLLTREQITSILWPDTFVDDHALSVLVAELRKILGDTPKESRFIETRPRRGYRFLNTQQMTRNSPYASIETPETHYATSGDVNIAYQVVGTGPIDIVFVMGWVSHLEYFWREPHFAKFLQRLSSFSRLILFDKRGTGLSDRVPLHELPTLEQRMEDLRAVMQAVGSERAVLFGVSEGGPMATLFSATYPDKTLGLIMFGSYARRLRDHDYPWGPTKEERDRSIEEMGHQWGGPFGIEERAPTLASDPEFRSWWATYLRMGASPGSAVALTRMNADIDVRPILPGVRVPTLVLHRKDDRCLLLAEGKYLADRIPNARFVMLSGADHLPFVGDQESVLHPIEAFLGSLKKVPEMELALVTLLCVESSHPVSDLPDGSAILDRFRARQLGNSQGTLYAAFDGPARAVQCAEALLESASKLGWQMRSGLHTGECEIPDPGPLGATTLDFAARLMELTHIRAISVSRVVRDLVAGSGLVFQESTRIKITQHGRRMPVFELTKHPE